MDTLRSIFGEGPDLNTWQATARAVAMFFVTLVLIRIAGRRSFGQRSPFDYVVALLLGATLSRVITGASPVAPTLAASLTLAVLHRCCGWLGVHFRFIERLMTGRERELYRAGKVDRRQMNLALVTERDLVEATRQCAGKESLEQIEAALLERNGEISIIHKSS